MTPFQPLEKKAIVRILAGKGHYVAYERVEPLSVNWKTEDVIKFAQREGFEDYIKIFKAEKVTGRVLLEMDKKYSEEVLGIINQKVYQKLSMRLQECNSENAENWLVHGWGRTAEGALGTNPSKDISKPLKVKLPEDCEIMCLPGQYTLLTNTKTKAVLGIINQKVYQKLSMRLQECNSENAENWLVHGWGRTAEGALGTNPSKDISKPLKVKLPEDCEIMCLPGQYTLLTNTKTKAVLANTIDEKTNKQEWKEVAKKKVWAAAGLEDKLVLIAAGERDRLAQRETEQIVHEKKDKLRTAKNIIDKITWDPNIEKEEFRVGYLDKYEGVLEVSFEELVRSDTKDYRIEYFKRGGKVVWDKKKRIDVL